MKILFYSFILLCLTSCSYDKPANVKSISQGKHYKTIEVDGVKCIVFSGHRSGGISCNWDEYNQRYK